MAYVSLYRRFRSQRFEEIVGQEHVTKALTNAIAAGTVGHAYLFSGPRGTGKTSMARILAKALNCENLSGGEPCGDCTSCKSIERGTSLDVYELDAASNNSVDDIRQLVASTALGTGGRTKVYVLDEVHMLSKAASNALLKTLEEPPEHVVFVLATTDPQKVLPTIRSRTQHFEFTLLAADELGAHVRMVIKEAELDVDDAMVDEIVRRGAGSARDTLSVLDQVAAAGGVADSGADVDDIVAALITNDVAAVLGAVASAISAGADPREMGESLTRLLRDMFLTLMGVEATEVPDSVRDAMTRQAKALGAARTVKAMETVGLALTEMRQATDARLTLEVALIQLTGVESVGVSEHDASPGATEPPAAVAAAAPQSAVAPASAEPAAEPAPPRLLGQGAASPAAAAREALKRSSAPPTPKSARQPTAAPAAGSEPESEPVAETVAEPVAETVAEPVVTVSEPPPEDVVAAANSGDARATSELPGGYPDVARLNAEWLDPLMANASGKVRSLYSAGTFLGLTNGRAVFSLPTGPHMVRCDPIRADVEALLESHYGVRIELDLIVEGQAVPTTPLPAPVAEPAADETVDLSALTDANDAPTTGVELFQNAFPGAELETNDEVQ